MSKFCPKCGYENPKKGKFCAKCGTSLEEISQTEEQQIQQPIEEQPQQQEFTHDIPPSYIPESQPMEQTSVYPPPNHSPQNIAEPSQHKESKSSSKMIMGLAMVAIVLSAAALSAAFLISPEAKIDSNSIGTTELQDSSVTSNKITNGAIKDEDINDNGISRIQINAITTSNILDGTITFQDFATDVYEKIINQTIVSDNIANNSITSEKIKDDEVKTNDIANNSITSLKIKDGEIVAADIATDGVNSAEIASGAVNTAELADDAVTYAKMAQKIKCGLATSVIHGTSVAHGLGSTPTSVVVTPVYVSTLESGNAVFHANVYDVTSTQFKIALWVEVQNTTANNPPQLLEKVDGITLDPQSVYWIAIYAP